MMILGSTTPPLRWSSEYARILMEDTGANMVFILDELSSPSLDLVNGAVGTWMDDGVHFVTSTDGPEYVTGGLPRAVRFGNVTVNDGAYISVYDSEVLPVWLQSIGSLTDEFSIGMLVKGSDTYNHTIKLSQEAATYHVPFSARLTDVATFLIYDGTTFRTYNSQTPYDTDIVNEWNFALVTKAGVSPGNFELSLITNGKFNDLGSGYANSNYSAGTTISNLVIGASVSSAGTVSQATDAAMAGIFIIDKPIHPAIAGTARIVNRLRNSSSGWPIGRQRGGEHMSRLVTASSSDTGYTPRVIFKCSVKSTGTDSAAYAWHSSAANTANVDGSCYLQFNWCKDPVEPILKRNITAFRLLPAATATNYNFPNDVVVKTSDLEDFSVYASTTASVTYPGSTVWSDWYSLNSPVTAKYLRIEIHSISQSGSQTDDLVRVQRVEFKEDFSQAVFENDSDSYFNNVSLLTPCHYGNYDASLNRHLGVYSGSNMISSAAYKFGLNSLYASAGHYYYADHASFDLTNVDFTVEAHVNIESATAGTGVIVSKRTNATTQASYLLWYDRTNSQLKFDISTNGTSSSTVITGGSLSIGTWYHVAVCRYNGNITMYIDGTQTGTPYAIGTTSLYSSSSTLGVGGEGTTSNRLLGYLENVRITVGVARRTSDFTPPQHMHPGRFG